MRCSLIEILSEVDALCIRCVPELSCHRKVDRLPPLNSERDSTVLRALISRMAQRRTLIAKSKRRHIRCMRSNQMTLEHESRAVDAIHCLSQLIHAARSSEDRQTKSIAPLCRWDPMRGHIDCGQIEDSLRCRRNPLSLLCVVRSRVSAIDVDPLDAFVSLQTAVRERRMPGRLRMRSGHTAWNEALHRAESTIEAVSSLELHMHTIVIVAVDECAMHAIPQ